MDYKDEKRILTKTAEEYQAYYQTGYQTDVKEIQNQGRQNDLYF